MIFTDEGGGGEEKGSGRYEREVRFIVREDRVHRLDAVGPEPPLGRLPPVSVYKRGRPSGSGSVSSKGYLEVPLTLRTEVGSRGTGGGSLLSLWVPGDEEGSVNLKGLRFSSNSYTTSTTPVDRHG